MHGDGSRLMVAGRWGKGNGAWPLVDTGHGAALGHYENVEKLNGDDDCTPLTILKAIDL